MYYSSCTFRFLLFFNVLYLQGYIVKSEDFLLLVDNLTVDESNPQYQIVKEDLIQELRVTPLPNGTQPSSLEYDPVDRYIYISDSERKVIERFNIDNSQQLQVLHNFRIDKPSSLALDSVNRLLYWSDEGLETISVSGLDGTPRKDVIHSNCFKPTTVLLGPKYQYMYWSCAGSFAKIEKSQVNGKNRQAIIYSDIDKPIAMAIDRASEKLYWIDTLKETLEECNLDGSSRRVILTNTNLASVGNFALDRNFYYWTELSEGVVYSYLRSNRTGRNIVLYSVGTRYEDLLYYNSAFVIPESTSCTANNGNCGQQKICLPSEDIRNCIDLGPDILNCPGDIDVNVGTDCEPISGEVPATTRSVDWSEPYVTGNLSTIVTQTHFPFSKFQCGSNSVVYQFRDVYDRMTSCNFTVELKDFRQGNPIVTYFTTFPVILILIAILLFPLICCFCFLAMKRCCTSDDIGESCFEVIGGCCCD